MVQISSRHILRVSLPLIAAVSALVPFAAERVSAQADRSVDSERVIFDDVAGPYNIKVSQFPARAIVGTLRIIVEPTDAETGLPVENALVRIFGQPEGEGERQFSPGLNSPANRTLYFGQLQLNDSGTWTIDVEVDSDQGRGLAISQMTIHERARSGDNTTVGTFLFVLVSVAFAGAFIWLWYSSRRARQRRDTIRSSGQDPRRSSG